MGTTVRKNRTHRRRGNVKSRKMTNNRSHLRQQRGGFIGLIFALGIITYGSLKITKKIMKYGDKIEGQIEKEFEGNAPEIIKACKEIVKKTTIEGVETETDQKKREIRMMYYILEAKDSGNIKPPGDEHDKDGKDGKGEVESLVEDLEQLKTKVIDIPDLKLDSITADYEPKPRYQRTLGKMKKSIMSKFSKLSKRSSRDEPSARDSPRGSSARGSPSEDKLPTTED